MIHLLPKSILVLLLLSPLTQASGQRGSLSFLRARAAINPDDAAVAGSQTFLDNLPAVLEKARTDGGIPGMSVAILHKGQLVFAQGFGKRNRKDPFTTEVRRTKKPHASTAAFIFSHDCCFFSPWCHKNNSPAFVDCVSYRIGVQGIHRDSRG